jgi:hypothetical protein
MRHDEEQRFAARRELDMGELTGFRSGNEIDAGDTSPTPNKLLRVGVKHDYSWLMLLHKLTNDAGALFRVFIEEFRRAGRFRKI